MTFPLRPTDRLATWTSTSISEYNRYITIGPYYSFNGGQTQGMTVYEGGVYKTSITDNSSRLHSFMLMV